VNVSDAVYITNYVFQGKCHPLPCIAGDCNGDHLINISDAVLIINYAFSGGVSPVAAYPDNQPNCPYMPECY